MEFPTPHFSKRRPRRRVPLPGSKALIILWFCNVRVRMLSPDAALLTERFTGRYRLDGREADFTERYTSIWVPDRGKWRLTDEQLSMVPQSK